MKKTLIALAAVAATGAVFAQSSVTLSGKANIGFIQESAGTAPKKSFQAAGGADGSASRLIFRGTEDLGGGLKANFHMEQGINLGNGATDATGTFQRQAWMGMSGGFGEIRAGRQYTLGFTSAIGYIPSTYTTAQGSVGFGYNGDTAVRNDAQLRYSSPSFGGLKVEVATQLKGNTAAALTEFHVSYGAGPLKAALYSGKTKGQTGSDLGISGSYDLGVAMLAAGYIDQAGSNTGKGVFLHAGMPLGSTNVYAQYARNTDNKQNALELGARYSLSKRTALYAHMVNNSKAAQKTKMALGVDHNF